MSVTFTGGHLITLTMENTIKSTITTVSSPSSVYTLPSDPPGGIPLNVYDNDPDTYLRSNALSPYNGYLLISAILTQVYPSCSSIFGEIGGIKTGNKEFIGTITLSSPITSPIIGVIYNGLFNK